MPLPYNHYQSGEAFSCFICISTDVYGDKLNIVPRFLCIHTLIRQPRNARGNIFLAMKRLSVLLIVLAEFLSGSADVFNHDDFTFVITGDKECAVTGTTLQSGKLTIPATALFENEEYNVTSIADSAFAGCIQFNDTLTIPESIKTIGTAAFYGCLNLKGDIFLPAEVTSIGTSAFYNCISLGGSITIPAGVTEINDSTFFNCSGVTGQLTVPDGITAIGAYAFSGCYNISGALVLPETITSIGKYAFARCSGFRGSMPLPSGLTEIEEGIFSQCNGFFSTLSIPTGVTKIGAYAFAGCVGLYDKLTLPAGLTSIGSYAFDGCSALTGSVNLPAGVTEIGTAVFSGCRGLTGSPVIPEGSTKIGEFAFLNCSGLDGTLKIPASVTEIGKGAFWGCSGLKGQLVIPDAVTIIGENAFEGCSGFTGALIIPEGVTVIEHGAFEGCSALTSLILPAEITSIGSCAFYGCENLGALTLPIGVTEIGNSAFYNCSNLTGALMLPLSLKTIGSSAFYNCSRLTGPLNIPENVESVGANAFEGCTGLTGRLIIPEGTVSIGDGAFSGCTGFIGDLVIPDGVKTIGANAFRGCTGLSGALTIPEGVTNIGNYAFAGCTGFNGELSLPQTLTYLGRNAFEGCAGITGPISLSAGITSIGAYAFRGCTGLTGDIAIPESVTAVGENAFAGCTGFNGILTLPQSLTNIESGAFSGCINLTGTLVLPDNISVIGAEAFKGCSGLTGKFILPQKVTSIGVQAFDGCSRLTGPMITLAVTPPVLDSIGDPAVTAFTGLRLLEDDQTIYVPKGSEEMYDTTQVWKFYDIRPIPDASLTLNTASLDMTAGDTATVSAEVTRFYAPSEPAVVTWNTSDPDIVTIDKDGTVIARRKGEAMITATLVEDSDITASCSVKVSPVLQTINGISFEVVPATDENTADVAIVIGGVADTLGIIAFADTVEIGNTLLPVVEITDSAFAGIDSISKVVIPASVEKVGKGAFAGRSGKLEVVTSDGDKPICFGDSVFAEDTIVSVYHGRDIVGTPFVSNDSIKSLVIGPKVTRLLTAAYKNCTAISDLKSFNPVPPAMGDSVFADSIYINTVLRVPDEVVAQYKAAEEWKRFVRILGFNEIVVDSIGLQFNDTIIEVGDTARMIAIIAPEEATNKNIIWKSTDEKIVTIDESGLITGTGIGNASVIATTAYGQSDTCNITVRRKTIHILEISFEADSVRLERTKNIRQTPVYKPYDANQTRLTWSTSNDSIATVDGSGLVRGAAVGVATITVTTETGLTAEYVVTVFEPMVEDTNKENPGDNTEAGTSAIDKVSADESVIVDGNNIFAPEGSRIFNIIGVQVKPIALKRGIYIILLPDGKSLKVKI